MLSYKNDRFLYDSNRQIKWNLNWLILLPTFFSDCEFLCCCHCLDKTLIIIILITLDAIHSRHLIPLTFHVCFVDEPLFSSFMISIFCKILKLMHFLLHLFNYFSSFSAIFSNKISSKKAHIFRSSSQFVLK